jgi:alkylhydroperoxidase/carboxymuconolactone decarboxylase family protein YurZ
MHDRRGMSAPYAGLGRAFQQYLAEAPARAREWTAAIEELRAAAPKGEQLAVLAVLAALGCAEGIPGRVAQARRAGATREEVIDAILHGAPAAGSGATAILPAALDAYDAT